MNYMNMEPDAAANQHIWNQEKEEAMAKKCDQCGEPIWDEYYSITEYYIKEDRAIPETKDMCEQCAEDWLEQCKQYV